MLKLKRKLSDIEEQDKIIESFTISPEIQFSDAYKWNNDFTKQKRRRFFQESEEDIRNQRMGIDKFSHDLYSQYFPKAEDLGLGM